MINTVLLDFDGVISDSLDQVMSSWQFNTTKFGNGNILTKDFVRSCHNGAWQSFYAEKLGIPKEDFEFQSLHVSLGPVVGRLKAHELQAQGVLAQCHVNIVQLQDHAEYNDYQSELKYLVTNVDRLEYISKIIDKIKDSGNTLILVDRIETGKLLQTYLSTLFGLLGDKPEAVFVSGSTKASDRKDEYDEIATSTNKVIIATYGVAAVGINIPRIFNLVMVESGKSFTRVIQSIGRGIRKAEDKDFVQIWDITSTCKFAKRHLTKRKAFYKDANYPFTVEKMEWK